MSEINSIAQGTYTLGQTSATTYQAGPGISITQPSEGTVRISNDETVLWENNNLPTSGFNGTVQLSEQVSAFNELDAYYYQGPASRRMFGIQRGYVSANSGSIVIGPWAENSTNGNWFRMSVSFNKNSATFLEFFTNSAGFNLTGDNLTGSYHMWNQGNIWKIVGINRISGGNA